MVLLAVSGFVVFEPAPYDLIAMAMFVFVYTCGLRVPAELGAPLLLWGLLVIATFVSILASGAPGWPALREMAVFALTTVYLVAVWLLVANITFVRPQATLNAVWIGYQIAAFVAVAAAVAGFFQLVPGHEFFTLHGRARGTFKDPNVFAPFLVPVAVYLTHRMLERWTWIQFVRVGFLCAILGALLLAFSRGGWGNLAVAAATFAALRFTVAESLSEWAKLIAVGIMALIVLLGLLASAASTPEVREVMLDRARVLQSYDVGATGRFSLQVEALKNSPSHPLGIGPNRTEHRYGQSPHNVYVKVLAENGWLGGASFVALIVLTLARGLASCLKPSPFQGHAIVLYASLAGTVAEGLIIDTLHWRHLFLLLGLLWGLIGWIERAEKAQPS